jgi:hypothetical protein
MVTRNAPFRECPAMGYVRKMWYNIHRTRKEGVTMLSPEHAERIYQPSDLNREGRALLNAARAGYARVRDKDGVSLVMLREEFYGSLEVVADCTAQYVLIEHAVSHSEGEPSLAEYGDWTWLRVFDREDVEKFLADMREALVLASRERSAEPIRVALHEWRETARSLADPVRREILLGKSVDDEYVDAARPELVEEAEPAAAV